MVEHILKTLRCKYRKIYYKVCLTPSLTLYMNFEQVSQVVPTPLLLNLTDKNLIHILMKTTAIFVEIMFPLMSVTLLTQEYRLIFTTVHFVT